MSIRPSTSGCALIGTLAIAMGCQQAAPTPAPAPVAVVARTETRVFRTPTRAQLDSFTFDVPLPADTGVCVRRPMPVGVGRTIAVYYPDQRQAVAFAVVTLDSAGRVVRFSDQRGRVILQGLRGASQAQLDSALAASRSTTRSSTLYLDYVLGQAVLGNDGGGQPEQHWMLPLSAVVNNPRFGRPGVRARQIVSRCSSSGPELPATAFEFQVQKPAAYVGGTAVSPHPVASGSTVVQFVVDSSGMIRPSTFKVLRAENDEIVADARRLLGQWRYLPAEVDGRKVAQLVQTAIAR
jgi:hypothetical protein